MISIEFKEDIQQRLLNLSNLSGQSVEHIITQHITDHLEDLEDIHISLKRLESNERIITLEGIEKNIIQSMQDNVENSRTKMEGTDNRNSRKRIK